MSGVRRCDGFDRRCRQPASWRVHGTRTRAEWDACEKCAREALLYNGDEVEDDDGVEQQWCDHDEHNMLICPRVAS